MKTNTSRPNYQKAEEIEKIVCGLTHSGCIRNGKVYIWGLYSNKESSALKIPTLVEFSASGMINSLLKITNNSSKTIVIVQNRHWEKN